MVSRSARQHGLRLLAVLSCAWAAGGAARLSVAEPTGSDTMVVRAQRIIQERRGTVSVCGNISDLIADLESLRRDCNGNGLRDSIDIADGTAEDANQNGVIDACDPDEAVFNLANHDSAWFRHSEQNPGTSYFAASFQRGHAIRIRYTVPAPGGRIELDVLDDRGRRIHRLQNARMLPGHYELSWDLTDREGEPFPHGRYVLRLRALGREYVRAVRWDLD